MFCVKNVRSNLSGSILPGTHLIRVPFAHERPQAIFVNGCTITSYEGKRRVCVMKSAGKKKYKKNYGATALPCQKTHALKSKYHTKSNIFFSPGRHVSSSSSDATMEPHQPFTYWIFERCASFVRVVGFHLSLVFRLRVCVKRFSLCSAYFSRTS